MPWKGANPSRFWSSFFRRASRRRCRRFRLGRHFSVPISTYLLRRVPRRRAALGARLGALKRDDAADAWNYWRGWKREKDGGKERGGGQWTNCKSTKFAAWLVRLERALLDLSGSILPVLPRDRVFLLISLSLGARRWGKEEGPEARELGRKRDDDERRRRRRRWWRRFSTHPSSSPSSRRCACPRSRPRTTARGPRWSCGSPTRRTWGGRTSDWSRESQGRERKKPKRKKQYKKKIDNQLIIKFMVK